jgi:hypothetical protein
MTVHKSSDAYLEGVVEPKIDTIDGVVDTLDTRSTPIVTTDTFSYLDAGGLQVVKSLTISKVTEVYFWLDLSNMTQDGTVVLQSKVDGSNYRIIMGTPFSPAQGAGAFIGPVLVNTDVQIAYSESMDEGAARDIIYRTIQITKED